MFAIHLVGNKTDSQNLPRLHLARQKGSGESVPIFLSVKQSFDFYGVRASTFVVVLQLLASGVFLLCVVLLPFVEETSPPPVGFDSSPPPVAVNDSKIRMEASGL